MTALESNKVYFRFAAAAVFSLLLILSGCASTPTPGTAAATYSRLGEIDRIVAGIMGDYLPPPEKWPPRVFASLDPDKPTEASRYLPLSSLAYLPRLFPRWRKDLAAAGLKPDGMEFTPDPDGNTALMRFRMNGRLDYLFRFTQRVAGRIALVIDDLGNTTRDRELLFSLDYPLTVAILPRRPYSSFWDGEAAVRGFDVILHCPLEPLNSRLDPGPGRISRAASPEEIARILKENLADLPHAIGVNNHMGSAFTRDTAGMEALLGEVGKRDIFFLDSVTISRTVTAAVARRLGVKIIRRDIFLDNEETEEAILRQWERLKKIARSRPAAAVAIGHYRPITLKLLAREVPLLAQDNLQLVPLAVLAEEREESE